jgi:hypothetical protein
MKRVRNSLIPEVHEDLFVANGSQRLAADAAFRCALTLEKRQFYAEAVRAYEHLVRVFKNDPDIFVQTQVAKALLNRAVIVGERVSPLAEKKVQDTLITHFVSKYGAKIPVGVDLQVAGAYINRGMLLENTKPESAKADYATAYALLETYLKTNSLPQGKLDNLDEHLTRISGLLTPAPTASELATTTPSADTNPTVEAATQINTDSHTPIEAATTDTVVEANLSSDNLTTTISEPEVAVVEPVLEVEAQPEPEVAVAEPTAEVDAQPEPEVVTVESAVAEVDAQPEPEVTSAEPAAEVEAQPEPEVVSAEPVTEARPKSEVAASEPVTEAEAQPESEIATVEPVAKTQPEPEVISAEPAAEVEVQTESEVTSAEPAIEVDAKAETQPTTEVTTQPEPEAAEVAIKPELTTTEVTLAIQPNGNATNPTATMLDDAQTSMLLPSEAVTEAIAPAGIAVETAIAQPLTSIPIQTTLGLAPELVASNDAQVAISLLETSPSVETQPIVSASEFIMIDIQPKDELTSRIFQALVHKRAILLTKAARPEVIAVDNALQANFADQLTPVQLADMWLFEASTYETQGDLDAALKVYDKIIGLQAA